MAKAAGRDPAQEITDYFIERLEAGHRPWIKPWQTTGSLYPLRATGEPYKGMNRFWLDIMGAHFASPYWMTYKQAGELGGQVRKGEHGQIALFYKTGVTKAKPEDRGDLADDGNGSRAYRVLRSYTVFNADQIDGLPERYHPKPIDRPVPQSEHREAIDAFFAAIPAKSTEGGNVACYRPGPDDILMPPKAAFTSYEHYASTFAHELGHWTGAKHRLNRTFGKSFGDNLYAAEELVALSGQSAPPATLQ